MSTTKGIEKISDVSAFIIAGGKGKRFGGDKLNHPYCGKPLIVHVAEVLGRIFSEVAIIADDYTRFEYLSFPCFEDLEKNVGPLAGIMTALHYAQTPRVLAVAGDMPSLNEEFIRYLVQISADYEVTVPKYRGEYEPLHAVYAKSCENAISDAVKRGERRIVSFFCEVRIREVSEQEIKRFANPEKIFYNINYKDDVR